MIKMRTKSIKCPICKEKHNSISSLLKHIGYKHRDQMPPGFTPARYFYFLRTGKSCGSCIVCKSPTEWIESTQKYSRYCNNPKCKENYKKIFNKRMIGKYGKISRLDEPEFQRKMLASKKNSGKYKFRDGGEIEYVSSYELDFLRFLDTKMNYKSTDIIGPSPHTYYYEYKNKDDKENEGRKFYIPDYYIPSLNLEIEVKQNTSTHPKILRIDKVKEKLKDEMMETITTINYIKVVDKDYDKFIKDLKELEKVMRSEEAIESAVYMDTVSDFEYLPNDSFTKISTKEISNILNDIHVTLLSTHIKLIKENRKELDKAIETLTQLSTKKSFNELITVPRFYHLIDDKKYGIDMNFINMVIANLYIRIENSEAVLFVNSDGHTIPELIDFLEMYSARYNGTMIKTIYEYLAKYKDMANSTKDFIVNFILQIVSFSNKVYSGQHS